MPATRTGPEVTGPTGPHALLRWAGTVLRGIGQVAMQANSVAGLVFVLAVAWSSPPQVVALLGGAGLGTALAALLGVDRAALREGMWGFNGALAALTTVLFAPSLPILWLAASLAAVATVPITLALQKLLRRWQLPTLSLPFILALWCVLLWARLQGAAPSGASVALPGLSAPVALSLEHVARSMAQVFFQTHVGTGVLVLLGLLVSAPRAALLAVLGTACASVTAWGLGASAEALQSGVHGFSGALTALVVGTVLLPAIPRHAMLAVLAAGATPFVQWGLSAALAGTGLPALTLPFVAVVWVVRSAF